MRRAEEPCPVSLDRVEEQHEVRLEFEIPRAGLKTVDYNFLAEYRTSVQGHKDFIRGGKLVSQEDVVLHAVDQAAYEAKRAELLRK
jgi:hypothetical protein